MRFFLAFLYLWGCMVAAEIAFDPKSSLYNPHSNLSTQAKIARILAWPMMIETEAIFNSAKDFNHE